jgi:hypothetical protein
LCWAGYWAPWIAHRAAALNFNGYELSEWITFLDAVRDGSLRLGRLDFLLPLACICAASALAIQATPGMPGWGRWALTAATLLGAFAILPEYPFILTAHADPELRPALVLALVVLAGVLAAGPFFSLVGRRLAGAYWEAVIAALGLGAAALCGRALAVAWPALEGLFNAPPRLNWGPFSLAAGAALLTAGAAPGLLDLYLKRRNEPRARTRHVQQ